MSGKAPPPPRLRSQLVSIISKLCSRLTLSHLHPLPHFLGLDATGTSLTPSAYSPPQLRSKSLPSYLPSRLSRNVVHFLPNYALLGTVTLAVVALSHPVALLAVSLTLLLWFLHHLSISSSSSSGSSSSGNDPSSLSIPPIFDSYPGFLQRLPFSLSSLGLPPSRRSALLTLLSAFVLVRFALGVLVASAGVCAFVTGVHATFRNSYYSFDEADNNNNNNNNRVEDRGGRGEGIAAEHGNYGKGEGDEGLDSV